MGSFFGHALPGTFFYIYGLWHLTNAFYYHFKFNGTQRNHTKKSAIAYSIQFCCQKKHIPIEGIIKLICCIIGMTVEGYGFFLHSSAMYQHFTMYSFFGFAGLVDILMFHDFAIPIKFDYCLHAFSLFVEGLLFAFHVHGRSHLDVTLHILLVYTCYFSAIMVFFMIIFEKHIVFNVLFGVGFLIQGSWFWQVGSILYPIIGKAWCGTCMHEVMNATVVFCWHLFFNAVLAAIIYSIVAKITTYRKSKTGYEHLENDPDLESEEQRSELLNKEKENMTDSFL